MTYTMKPLGCDPRPIKGMSERLIVSHYENNYGGAVKRLNLIDEQLAGLDFATAPGFLINGLKREQLIATNSMILHELFFDGLGEESAPGTDLAGGAGARFRLATSAGARSSSPWARRSAAARAGCCCRGRRATAGWSTSGRADHCHTLAGGQPILALDMYEHSYHIDYGAKAATYVDTFMEVIRWSNAERVFVQMTDWSRERGRYRAMSPTKEETIMRAVHVLAICATGDGRHRRQRPGHRLEEGRRGARTDRRRIRRRSSLRLPAHRPAGDARRRHHQAGTWRSAAGSRSSRRMAARW